jgi:hypothetical protein
LQAWKKPAVSVEEEQQPQEDDDADDEEESQHKMSGKTSSLASLLELTDLWTQIASQRLQKNKTKTKTKQTKPAVPVDSLKSRNSLGITSLLTLPAYNKTQQKSKRVSDSHQFRLNFNSNACATRMTILITHSLTHAAQHQQNSNN